MVAEPQLGDQELITWTWVLLDQKLQNAETPPDDPQTAPVVQPRHEKSFQSRRSGAALEQMASQVNRFLASLCFKRIPGFLARKFLCWNDTRQLCVPREGGEPAARPNGSVQAFITLAFKIGCLFW